MIKTNLQRVLDSKLFWILSLLAISILIIINLSIERKSSLNLDDKTFTGVLKKYSLDEFKVSFTLDLGSENLVCNYYFKEDESKRINTYNLGSIVEVKGSLKEPLNNTVPNAFNYKKYLYYHNTFYTCTIDEITVKEENKNLFYKMKNSIIKRIMTFEIRDYLYTMIIGDKSLMDEETFELYRQNGITHLFAISGMHVGLFSVFLLKVFKRLGEKKKYIPTILFIWFYAFLAGLTPSVLRASLLFSLFSLNKMMDINISSIKVLILTACILIFVNPFIIMDIGFTYSFLTTFGLIISSNILKKHKLFGTSLVATLYSLPVTINNFYKYNLLSPCFNIVFVPFVSCIVYPLCLLTFIFRFLEPLTKFSIFFLELLNTLSSKLDFLYIVIPKISIILVVIYYAILVLALKKKFYIVSILLLSLIILTKMKPLLDASNHVNFLDVGQGDSTLIRSKHSEEIILIDTGGVESFDGRKSSYHVASNTITYLNSLGINRIDLLILTHGDADHLGDALYLMENIKVKSVMINKGKNNESEKKIIATGINVVDKYNGKLDIAFLNDKDWNEENSNSIVTSLKLDGIHIMLMGDASKEVERYMLKTKTLEKVDILKLGHHGSKTSSDKSFLEKLNVDMGIISCGRGNRYNHPNKETLDTLKALNIPYKNTQVDGSISLDISDSNVTYKTCPP